MGGQSRYRPRYPGISPSGLLTVSRQVRERVTSLLRDTSDKGCKGSKGRKDAEVRRYLVLAQRMYRSSRDRQLTLGSDAKYLHNSEALLPLVSLQNQRSDHHHRNDLCFFVVVARFPLNRTDQQIPFGSTIHPQFVGVYLLYCSLPTATFLALYFFGILLLYFYSAVAFSALACLPGLCGVCV